MHSRRIRSDHKTPLNYEIDARSPLCKNFWMQLSFTGMQQADVDAPEGADNALTGIRRRCADSSHLSVAELSEQAGRYLQSAHAESTLRCYQRDWSQFEQFCQRRSLQAMPCAPQTLALYLTSLAADARATSSIRRARMAISKLHQRQGFPRPDQAACVRDVERGIRRRHGTAQKQARPVLLRELQKMLAALGESPVALRDRALLLIGFAGGFRRAELVAMDVDDVTRSDQGLLVRLLRSKADRWGKGEYTALPCSAHAGRCPAQALDRYLGALRADLRRRYIGRGAAASPTGSLFRAADLGRARETLSERRLGSDTVGQIVRRAAAAAGLQDPEQYSSHSLRAGLATSAYLAGASLEQIQRQGRWSSQAAMMRYVRVAADFGPRNAAAQLL